MAQGIMKKRARVSKERTINTYTEMWHASRVLLYKGQEDKKGSYLQFMASLIFTAFTFEAYLNHIGTKVFECWKDVESLSPLKKFSLICEMLSLEVEYSRRPYQTLTQLFKFRNDIAHGKTATIKSDEQIRYVDDKLEAYMHKPLLASWEKFCTGRNASRVREDIEKIIHELHDKANIQDDPAFFPSMAFGSMSLIHEDDTS